MATVSEVAYISRDNSIDLLLKDDSSGSLVFADLSTATKFELISNTGVTVNSIDDPTMFILTDVATGKLCLKVGSSGMAAGAHTMQLVVYDPDYTNGIVWGEFRITMRA